MRERWQRAGGGGARQAVPVLGADRSEADEPGVAAAQGDGAVGIVGADELLRGHGLQPGGGGFSRLWCEFERAGRGFRISYREFESASCSPLDKDIDRRDLGYVVVLDEI